MPLNFPFILVSEEIKKNGVSEGGREGKDKRFI